MYFKTILKISIENLHFLLIFLNIFNLLFFLFLFFAPLFFCISYIFVFFIFLYFLFFAFLIFSISFIFAFLLFLHFFYFCISYIFVFLIFLYFLYFCIFLILRNMYLRIHNFAKHYGNQSADHGSYNSRSHNRSRIIAPILTPIGDYINWYQL